MRMIFSPARIPRIGLISGRIISAADAKSPASPGKGERMSLKQYFYIALFTAAMLSVLIGSAFCATLRSTK